MASTEATETLGMSRLSEAYLRTASEVLEVIGDAEAWSEHVNWGERLEKEGALTSPLLIEAFKAVRRYDFLPREVKPENFADRPRPIPGNQTISQPSLVANMLEALDPQRGEKVLDLGSGSGWTTALLAHAVGERGEVIGVERIPELVEFGQANLARYPLPWARIEQADEQLGLPAEAPFDRILVSGQLKQEWVEELSDQLSASGSVMVAPLVSEESYGKQAMDQSIVRVERHEDQTTQEVLIRNVGFVPIVVGELLIK